MIISHGTLQLVLPSPLQLVPPSPPQLVPPSPPQLVPHVVETSNVLLLKAAVVVLHLAQRNKT